MDDTDGFQVQHNRDASRYELHAPDGLVGFADYDADSARLVMTYTEIDRALRGRGLGDRLIAAALDDVRARNLTVVPACPFVASFIQDHPEYEDLVAAPGGSGPTDP